MQGYVLSIKHTVKGRTEVKWGSNERVHYFTTIKSDDADVIKYYNMQGQWEKHMENILMFLTIMIDNDNITIFLNCYMDNVK